MQDLTRNETTIAARFTRLWLVIIATGWLSLLGLALYRLLLHPLRDFPGPKLAKVSKLWARLGNFYGQKSHKIHEAHLKYGPVVRVGPNELSFADPAAVHDIYTSDVFVKEESFYRAKRVFHENHLMSFRNAQAHAKRRKLLQRGFSQAAMIEFEPQMTTKIEAVFRHWIKKSEGNSSRVVDVYPWLHWMAFDIVYHLMFDEDPGSVDAGQSPRLMPYIQAWKPTFIYKELVPQLEQWGPYVPGYIGEYFRKVQTWKGMAVDIIRRCRGQEIATPFLKPILQGQQDDFLGRELTDGELAEECMGGMFGGSGTTANTLTYLLWACAKSPEIIAKLQQELDAAFGRPAALPDFSACAGLPYLQAVIDETLRLYPTIIATLPRTATTSTFVAGVKVPAGTIVGTQNLTIHQDPAAFSDPQEFKPERWLDKNNEQEQRKAFVPFSIGSRRCIGINLARMELVKFTAAFFLHFDIELDASMTEDMMKMYDNFSAAPASSRLLLRLKAR